MSKGRTDALILSVLSFPLLFWRLGDLPLVLWDESRLANNALEMSRQGLSLVTTYAGRPDLWNTKPPALIWMMAGMFMSFGPSELALRLPSAIAALATVLLVGEACRRISNNRWAGLAAGAMLLTTEGYVGPHVARTGDYDALLTCFTTIVVLGSLKIISDLQCRVRLNGTLLVTTVLALSGAILTKGVGGLLILPGIVIAAIASGVFFAAIREPKLLVIAAAPIVVAVAYYGGREMAGSGYMSMIWMNELGGRYGAVADGNKGPFTFYLAQLARLPALGGPVLYSGSGAPWSWFALLLLPMSLRDALLKNSARYLAIVIAVFLLVISFSATKTTWYVAPAYPVLAMLAAINGYAFYRLTLQHAPIARRYVAAASLAICLGVLGIAAVERNRQLVVRAKQIPELVIAARLKELSGSLAPQQGLRIVRAPNPEPALISPDFAQYSPQERFYVAMMRQDDIDARFIHPKELALESKHYAPRDPLDITFKFEIAERAGTATNPRASGK